MPRLADFRLHRASGVRVLPGETGVTSYRDGAEQYLFQALGTIADRRVGSPEVAALVRDWASLYHLSPYRATLLDCLGLSGIAGARVLELGAGCGVMTRWLGDRGAEVHAIEGGLSRAEVARRRCEELANVELYAGNYSALDVDGGFDLVTLIGVLEYSHLYHPLYGDDPAAAASANLELAARALGDEGVLVLAIENRMGLKYLNGAREDHSGRAFEGIQGYPFGTGSPVTWSLRELERLLAGAGFGHVETLVPYPDYKLAHGVVNPARCGDEDAIHNWLMMPAPDRGATRRPTLFNESLAVREVARAGLLAELANSHLLVAHRGDPAAARERLGIDLSWSARHYSLDRRPGLRKRITLAAGAIEVSTRPLGEDLETAEAARAAVREFGLAFAPEPEPRRRGDLLSLHVLEAIVGEEGLGARYEAHLREYRRWLLSEFGAGEAGGVAMVRGDAFDATWWNVVVHPETGEWQPIDREWRLELPVPADYVLWRMLTVFFTHHTVQLARVIGSRTVDELVRDGMARAGAVVTAELLRAFKATEGAVLRAIEPGPLPAGRSPELERWAGLAGAPRSFSVLAFADEVVERPALLAGYARHFAASDPATLVLYAPGADEAEAAARVEGAMAIAGLGDDAPDLMLLTAAATPEAEAAIAAGTSALLSERAAEPPFALLPRAGCADVHDLRPYAEAVWAGAPAR
jgi:methyltransferase family protein